MPAWKILVGTLFFQYLKRPTALQVLWRSRLFAIRHSIPSQEWREIVKALNMDPASCVSQMIAVLDGREVLV